MGRKCLAAALLATSASLQALSFRAAPPARPELEHRWGCVHDPRCGSSTSTCAPERIHGAATTLRRSRARALAAAPPGKGGSTEEGGTGGGGGGGGFGPSEEKLSRRAAKKAKARGGAPVIPVSTKAPSRGGGSEVSKAVVADVLRGQTSGKAKDADRMAARDAIERMEREEQERLAERQARIAQVLEERKAAEEDPSAGSIPEVVSNRMLSRMVPFFLVPAIGGVGVFVAVYVLSKNYDYTIPAYIVAYATQAPFFIALVGITYAILSASWDEDREGTFLGTEEFKRNLGNIYDGLKRSSDRMDVEDMLANEEAQKMNRAQRRQMRKAEDKSKPGA